MAATHKWRRDVIERSVREGIARALDYSALAIQAEVLKNLSRHGRQPSRGVSTGGTPGVRTGTLRRSWQAGKPGSIKRTENIRAAISPSIVVGSNVKYARIHEYGGTISAKRAKYLTIPLNRQAEKMLIAAGGSVRGIPGLFRTGKVTGNSGGVLAMRTGRKNAKVVPLFALKRSVRIPARPYIRPAVRKARPKIIAAFNRFLTLGRAGGVAAR